MCNCINEVGKKIELRLLEKAPEGAEVSRGFDTGWEGSVFSFTSGELLVTDEKQERVSRNRAQAVRCCLHSANWHT